jgi:hypothetical protein
MKAIRKETILDEKEFEDYLTEIYDYIEVCGFTYASGSILREIDPIAFGCAKSDYEDYLGDKWACGICGNEFGTEDEAEDCCKEE